MIGRLQRFHPIVLMFTVCLFLSACGGGSDDNAGTAPPPESDPPTANTSITLSWTTPGQRENGEVLSIDDLGGYEIAYRKVGEVLFTSIVITNPYGSGYVIDGLESGSYEIKIAAFDSSQIYSAFSDLLTTTI